MFACIFNKLFGREASSCDGERQRPHVIVDFVFDGGIFFIAVKNIGHVPAVRVSTTFDCKITGAGGRQEISSLHLFRNIEYLAPQKTISTFLDTADSYFKREEPLKIVVDSVYHDTDGRSYKTSVNHDLGIYRDILYLKPARGNSRAPAGAFSSEEKQFTQRREKSPWHFFENDPM